MIPPVRRKTLVAVAAGALSVAGFGDLPLWPLSLLAFAALLRLWHTAETPRQAAGLGYAWGVGAFLVGVSWVYVSLHDFGMMPAPLAAVATLLFCLYLALFPAAAGYLQAHLPGSPALRLMLYMPACWVLTEWLRGWLLTGFPWLAFGYSTVDTPLAAYAPLVGVYGLSLLAAIAMGALVAFMQRGHERIIGAAVFVALIGAGLTLRSVTWTRPVGAPISVSLLQGNIPQELKFVPGRYEQTLHTYARLARTAPAQLIVLPETAIPRFLDQVDPAYLEQLADIARVQSGDMLVPAPLRDANGGYYNAAVSLGTAPMQRYAKVHLVPFGEFIPPGFGWVLNVLQIPLSDFSAGATTQRPLHVAGERVALNICYEDAFGEEIIRQLPEATLLVNVSNVAWFGDSLAPEQHLRIARMRALETGRTMLRATNTGITAIIEADGTVQRRLPPFTEGALLGSAQGREGATPYVRFGNWPALIWALGALGLGVLHRRRA
ncbi:MAG TPA: apolipoprotein N-acyltransferase [Burkholderiales bacterium]|nr:apolipoprotein N-acyltransferase [Burkholderiales bacterium]